MTSGTPALDDLVRWRTLDEILSETDVVLHYHEEGTPAWKAVTEVADRVRVLRDTTAAVHPFRARPDYDNYEAVTLGCALEGCWKLEDHPIHGNPHRAHARGVIPERPSPGRPLRSIRRHVHTGDECGAVGQEEFKEVLEQAALPDHDPDKRD